MGGLIHRDKRVSGLSGMSLSSKLRSSNALGIPITLSNFLFLPSLDSRPSSLRGFMHTRGPLKGATLMVGLPPGEAFALGGCPLKQR